MGDSGHREGRPGQTVGLVTGDRLLGREHLLGEERTRRCAEPDDRGDVLHPRPPGPLLVATHDEGLEPQAATHEERPDPRRPAELVRGDRDEVGAELVEVDREMADRGHRVDVAGDPLGPAPGDDLVHRLKRADLVVPELAVDERRGSPEVVVALLQRGFEPVEIDPTEVVDSELHDRCRPRRRVSDRRVLDP